MKCFILTNISKKWQPILLMLKDNPDKDITKSKIFETYRLLNYKKYSTNNLEVKIC